MAVKKLVYDGDARLKEKCKEVKKIDENIKILAEDMLDTMYKFDGIGLAACQIGQMVRVVTYDVNYIDDGAKKKPMVLINPKIVWTSKSKVEVEEGCLSFPDIFKNVTRYEKVKMEYFGLDGKKRMVSATGIEAVVIQHELDHLDGIVFLDRIEK